MEMIASFFLVWDDIGLIVYAILKAFLPLPSLEMLLIPMCLYQPHKWFIYTLEGSIGTCIGGAVGYYLAKIVGRKGVAKFVSTDSFEKGEALLAKYGMWAIFIGGITPIPDFILPYFAGIFKMNIYWFLFSDGIARFLRSIIVSYTLVKFQARVNIESVMNYCLIFIIMFFLGRYLIERFYNMRKKSND